MLQSTRGPRGLDAPFYESPLLVKRREQETANRRPILLSERRPRRPSPSGLLSRVVPTAPSTNEPRGPRVRSSASAPAQDFGRSVVLPSAIREQREASGVQGAAMSPLVAGTRPAKSWQDAPAASFTPPAPASGDTACGSNGWPPRPPPHFPACPAHASAPPTDPSAHRCGSDDGRSR